MTIFFGLLLGATVGATLGLIGAGGAILAVPGLVAVLGLSATAATTSSTIIVGSAALAGALWPLSTTETASAAAGAWLLLRCMLTAVVLTVFLSSIAERMWDFPVNESLAPVAFLISALGNGWRPVLDAFGLAIAALLGKFSEGKK